MSGMRPGAGRRGFTLVELAAVMGVAGVAGSAAVVGLGQPRDEARQKKDENQVRGIVQAMVNWAQHNADRYPLPSALDSANATVELHGQAKNTTGNIMSLLVFNGAISTEILVSPAEKNPNVEVKQDYHFDQPAKAAKPAQALWDPTLSAELGPKKGHISYAHLEPFGGRMPRWSNTFVTSEAVVANRGPEVKSVSRSDPGAGPASVVPRMVKEQSIASLVYGDGVAWAGVMGFNDCHIEFSSGKLASGKKYVSERTYQNASGKSAPDVWCFDEPDDRAAVNDYLGLFLRAGEKRGDWKGAWD